MEYFSLLNLQKEPFSNAPDPELFYNSFQHQNCLQKLEMSIRLRRGLCVVIGDIGTGKSTLSRQLLRHVNTQESKIVAHLILDPEFTSPNEFLQTVIQTLGIADCDGNTERQTKEAIKNYLFQQGVDQEFIPTIIIDEGQKLPNFCIEILRELLNFETNQHKLLQIIIFAQTEFNIILKEKANFTDRITTLQYLRPLSMQETGEMIHFRINKTRIDPKKKIRLFSSPALILIHLLSGGYPRKIVMLCSKIILNMLIKNKKKAGIALVLSSAKETSIVLSTKPFRIGFLSLLLLSIVSSVIFYNLPIIEKTVSEMIPDHAPAEVSSHKTIVEKPIQTGNTQGTPSSITEPEVLEKIVTPAPEMATSDEKITEEPAKIDNAHEVPSNIAVPKISIINIPNILGSLPVETGDSLSRMISKIYGKYTTLRLESILALNHKIPESEKILVGTSITFPNLLINKFSKERFVIEFYKSNSFKNTFDKIEKYRDEGLSVLIMPSENVEEKITSFAVVMEKSFSSIDQAEKEIKTIHPKYKTATIKHFKPL